MRFTIELTVVVAVAAVAVAATAGSENRVPWKTYVWLSWLLTSSRGASGRTPKVKVKMKDHLGMP